MCPKKAAGVNVLPYSNSVFDIQNALSIKLNGVTKKSPKSMQAVKCNSYKTKRVTTLNGNGKCIL